MDKMDYPSRRNGFDQNLDYQLMALLNCSADEADSTSDTEGSEEQEINDAFSVQFEPFEAEEEKTEPIEEPVEEIPPIKTSHPVNIAYIAVPLVIVGIAAFLCFHLFAHNKNEPEQSGQSFHTTGDGSAASTTTAVTTDPEMAAAAAGTSEVSTTVTAASTTETITTSTSDTTTETAVTSTTASTVDPAETTETDMAVSSETTTTTDEAWYPGV